MTRRFDDSPDDSTASSDSTDARTDSHATSTWKVLGQLDTAGATGVLGHNTATSGTGVGVEGITDSGGTDAAGLRGEATASTGVTYGVAGFNNSEKGGSAGVYGEVTAASNTRPTNGVMGLDPTENGAGVYGYSGAPSGPGYGVVGEAVSPSGLAVYAIGDSKTNGKHVVDGHVEKSANATAYLASSQSIPKNTATRVEFDSTTDDTAGDDFGAFDTTNNKYVVPVAGDYRVDVTIEWLDQLPAGVEHNINLKVGTSTEASWIRQTPPNGGQVYCQDHGSTVLMGLATNDEITVDLYQTSGTSQPLGSDRSSTHVSFCHVG